jgi:hypothetical protein
MPFTGKAALKIIRKYGEQPIWGATPALFAFCKIHNFIGLRRKTID